MCGISGVIYFDQTRHVEQSILKKMSNIIAHRGPDDEGFYFHENIGFGFRRLSIIDLNSGSQPMHDSTNRLTIVFNGEIYNYLELKKELLVKGFSFNTTSDTEVILNLYLAVGKDFVQRLRGMFAFVIWDSKEKTIIASRDRFGIKPFYYYLTEDTFIFSSELKSIMQVSNMQLSLDIKSIESFFTYGYIIGEHTIYKEVSKLKPATLLVINFGKKSLQADFNIYWQPEYSSLSDYTEEDYAIYINEALKETVKKHMVSDVPVGAFLSGGMDSSSVVASIASLGIESFNTFSIGFKESKYNELPFARMVADKFGTKHHELIVEPESASLIEKVLANFDEPFADSSAIPTYIVSKLAAQHVKVVLSGDGGDELFAGYDTYKRLQQTQKFKFIPQKIKGPLFSTISTLLISKLPGKRFTYYLSKEADFTYAYFAQVYDNEKKLFYNPDFYNRIKKNPIEQEKEIIIKRSKAPDFLSRMMELDTLTYMVDDVLTKVDRSSMLTSLEVRVPLIDHVFANKMYKIPSYLKLNNKEGKYIFKKAMKSELPDAIFSHAKQGFTIPINEWFKDDLKELVNDTLSNNNELSNYVNKKYLETIKDANKAGSLITRIWPIMVLSLWLDRNNGKYSV